MTDSRAGLPNDGIDSIQSMAEKGIFVVDRVVQEEMGGGIDLLNDRWLIPTKRQSDQHPSPLKPGVKFE